MADGFAQKTTDSMRRGIGNAQCSLCSIDGNLEGKELQREDELRKWYTQTFKQTLPANAPFPFVAGALLPLPSHLARRKIPAEGAGVKGFENTFGSQELFGSLLKIRRLG